jgi:hypothetical protein
MGLRQKKTKRKKPKGIQYLSIRCPAYLITSKEQDAKKQINNARKSKMTIISE